MAERLQIICFKIRPDQLVSIDDLIRDQLYFSRSEIFRMAIRHLLTKLSSDAAYHLSRVPWESETESLSNFTQAKDSISSKLPPVLLKCVDEVVSHGIFTSRSHFIRESIRLFLEDRKLIHSAVKGGAIAS